MHPAIGEVVFPIHLDSQIVLGRRGGGAGIELNWDKRISRRHAVLRISNKGEIFYRDLGSRNGSYYGAERITGEIRFDRGMSVLVGETVMLVSDIEDQLEDPWGSESTEPGGASDEEDLIHSASTASMAFGMEDMTTKEMQSPEAEIPILDPVPDLAETTPRSTTARFVATGKVEVLFADRRDFRSFWENELSRTGMFVVTDQPPRFGTRVDVLIETPDGVLELTSSVVHVVPPGRAQQFDMSPGVGLQINDLTADVRDALERYALGESTKLGIQDQTPEIDRSTALARARQFLAAYDAERYYDALEISPSADGDAIAARLKELEDLFASTSGAAEDMARLNVALEALSKLSIILGVQQRRLQYDFRMGHLRVHERLAAARDGTGAPLGELRRAWNFVYPEHVERSAMLMREAFAASHVHDYGRAIERGTEALRLNPFFDQLAEYLHEWKSAWGDGR